MNEGPILVTGADDGIAQHVVRHLLDAGRRDVVCHVRGERDGIDAILRGFGLSDAHAVQADLCDEASVQAMRDAIESRHGAPAALVNVGGTSSNAMSWEADVAGFRRVLDDGLLSTFLCCRAFVPAMRERRFGRIVNVASIVGAAGIVGATGIAGFTRSIAQELAARGITANTLALGHFDTGPGDGVPEATQAEIRARIPVGRPGGQADVGEAVEYLIGPGAAFLTGQVIHLDGGQVR